MREGKNEAQSGVHQNLTPLANARLPLSANTKFLIFRNLPIYLPYFSQNRLRPVLHFIPNFSPIFPFLPLFLPPFSPNFHLFLFSPFPPPLFSPFFNFLHFLPFFHFSNPFHQKEEKKKVRRKNEKGGPVELTYTTKKHQKSENRR